MIFMMDVVDELKNELSSGAGIGTLGDAKMNEWNSINSNEIIKVEEKVPIENQNEPTQNEQTIDSNVAIIVTVCMWHLFNLRDNLNAYLNYLPSDYML